MKVTLALLTLAGLLLLERFPSRVQAKAVDNLVLKTKILKLDAFKILDAKCNVCHRKKNPFMVFSLKNMEKRSSKIHKQVFVKRRMPKGNDIQLTADEYGTLKNWLLTQNIF